MLVFDIAYIMFQYLVVKFRHKFNSPYSSLFSVLASENTVLRQKVRESCFKHAAILETSRRVC